LIIPGILFLFSANSSGPGYDIRGFWAYCESKDSCDSDSAEAYMVFEDSAYHLFVTMEGSGLELLSSASYYILADTFYSVEPDNKIKKSLIKFLNPNFFFFEYSDGDKLYLKRMKE
jgi:hypothetical protein